MTFSLVYKLIYGIYRSTSRFSFISDLIFYTSWKYVKLPDIASLTTYLTYRYPSRLFHIVVLLSVSTGRGLQLFWGPPRTLPDPGHRQAQHVEEFDPILALLPLIACYAIFPSDILINYCMWC
jgi:hypothetical protein